MQLQGCVRGGRDGRGERKIEGEGERKIEGEGEKE